MITENPKTHGAIFAPIVLGSDKTTVSVGTGHTEYYPLYLSLGNLHNNIHQAHCNAIALLGALAIPKSEFSHVLPVYSIANAIYAADLKQPNKLIEGTLGNMERSHLVTINCYTRHSFIDVKDKGYLRRNSQRVTLSQSWQV